MKFRTNLKTGRRTRCVSAVFSAVLLLGVVNARAQEFIAAPESLPGGLSYQQWSAKWFQWAWSIPASMNPILDHTGADCAISQPDGPVWFLAGTSGFEVTRTCLIPKGKMIFFPIINLGNDYPCPKDPDFKPGPGQSLEQFLTIGYGPNPAGRLIPGARQFIDHVTALSANLDGVALRDLILPPEMSKYRATSPLFEFNGDLSLRETLDPCVGPGFKAVSDGYWIMLKPLPPGHHTLFFSGTETFPDGSFTVPVTYLLEVRR